MRAVSLLQSPGDLSQTPLAAILLEALAGALWVGSPALKRGTVLLPGQSLIGKP